ncbi:formyl-CoA transferase [Rubrivivax benzoatilyticus JA2 = ATCC BAA-35]|nr:formyl-CoA transferase [Rubrivivax benzoatilyticus JA2 = ATCC BAA-35]
MATSSTSSAWAEPAAGGPLAGLKVLELGQLIAGPFAAKTLADFGAEVIKIEPPDGGDPLRRWRLLKDGTSVWWQLQSRNKRSVALDLKDPRGPGRGARAGARSRRADRELPPRRAGRFRPRARGADGGQPAAHRAACQRLRPDRAVPRQTRLRRRCRGDGRPASPERRTRARAGAGRRVDRRHAGGAARRHRRADGAARARPERPRPDHRRRALRGGFQLHGEPAARVQRLRRRARPGRQRLAGHRAEQRLRLPRRPGAGGRQRRQHLPPADDGHRPRGPGRRPGTGRQHRPRRACAGDRRRDRRLDRRAHGRRGAGRAGRRRGAGRPHLHRRRHRARPALRGARDAAAGDDGRRQHADRARHRAQAVAHAGQPPPQRAGAGPGHRRGAGGAACEARSRRLDARHRGRGQVSTDLTPFFRSSGHRRGAGCAACEARSRRLDARHRG